MFIAFYVALAIFVACFASIPPLAQGYNGSVCMPQDVLTIRDAGPGRAILTYGNSVNKCSVELKGIRLTSPNGIAVDVWIELLGEEYDQAERITIRPVDADMLSFPPNGDLIDGETREFIIMGGLA